MSGRVTLVGAGPGDPGLITVRAVRALEEADVVLYDHLSASELLRYAPAQAEHIYVGKKAGAHSMKQQDINRLLVELANEGKRVVRLKGGDPFVFGRGGEEGQALAKAGVAMEVVPGISSAFAVPAYAGIPVTHRGVASGLAVVTGHEDPSKKESALDWSALARMDTLVVLMGVGNLPRIVEQLCHHGREASTPVALVEWGTLGRQRTVVGTLADIVQRVQDAALRPPAVIVVGDVVQLRRALNWFETKPLQGLRVLVTRTRQQASKLSLALRAQGAEPVECPLIETAPPEDWAPLDAAIRRLDRYDWLVFTSTNGVEAFFRRLRAAGRDARALGGTKLAAIGSATAAALADYNLQADVVPDSYTAEALAQAIVESTDNAAALSVLLPRSSIARPDLVQLLQREDAQVDEVAAYRTVKPDGLRQALNEALGEVDAVTFTSSSTVRHFVDALGPVGTREALQSRLAACIGPITAGTLREAGVEPGVVAQEYTIKGLVEALVAWRERDRKRR